MKVIRITSAAGFIRGSAWRERTEVVVGDSEFQSASARSVAARLEPEILIVDEVLAVGDAEFQKVHQPAETLTHARMRGVRARLPYRTAGRFCNSCLGVARAA